MFLQEKREKKINEKVFKLVVLLSCSFLLITLLGTMGCQKKQVDPYLSTGGTGSGEYGADGTDSYGGYGSGSGVISEEFSAVEDSLTAGVGEGGVGYGSSSYDSPYDPNDEEYKVKYGRSSREMLPVYFDFDQVNIRPDMVANIEHNAEFLRNNPGRSLVIEGNTDVQGTNEYNMALGERRAESAKRYLVALGIEDYRIRTISFGEERQLFTGNTELDFSRNRRADFVLE